MTLLNKPSRVSEDGADTHKTLYPGKRANGTRSSIGYLLSFPSTGGPDPLPILKWFSRSSLYHDQRRLAVTTFKDRHLYATGLKVSDEELAALNLSHDPFHGG